MGPILGAPPPTLQGAARFHARPLAYSRPRTREAPRSGARRLGPRELDAAALARRPPVARGPLDARRTPHRAAPERRDALGVEGVGDGLQGHPLLAHRGDPPGQLG